MILPIESIKANQVYIVMGIDEHEHDQVLAVFASYHDAKVYCCETVHKTVYYDLWIEKHEIM